MRLLTLRLENFRQHAHSEMAFGDGMTAIVGANGSGKSTILEAITFALYGEQRDKKETIRFHWAEKKKFLVRLGFEFDGRRFEVERTNDSAHLKSLEEPPKVLATGLGEVTRACERLLSLGYEQFINSFCAEQKGLAFLQFRSNAARQEEVARMLGFDRLKSAEDLAGTRRREAGLQREALERTLGDVEALQGEREAAEARLKEVLSGRKENEARRKQTLAALPAARERRTQAERWTTLRNEMSAIRGEADGLKTAVAITERDLADAQAATTERQAILPAETRFREVEAKLDEMRRWRDEEGQRALLAAEADRLTQEETSLTERIDALEVPDLVALGAALSEVHAEREAREAEVREVERAWREAQTAARAELAAAETWVGGTQKELRRAEEMAARGVCPECGQAVGTDFLEGLARRRTELADAERAREKAAAGVASLREPPPALHQAQADAALATTRRTEAQRLSDAASNLAAQAATLAQERAAKAARVAKLRAQIDALPARYDAGAHRTLEAEHADLRPAHDRFLALGDADARLASRQSAHERAQAAYEAARARYQTLDAQSRELPFSDASEAQAAIAEHQALDEARTRAEIEAKGLAEMAAYAERALASAQARLAEYRTKLEELKGLRTREILHDVASKEMRTLRLDLNRTLGPDLAARASENLSLLTNGRYPVVELDKNFAPSLIDEGVVKSVISGGEEDVVALSLRLALSELIQERQGRPMSLLILDEVFGALDADRRQSVLDRLTALKGRFEQILVISHIEEINQVADGCLYVSRDPATRAAVVGDAPVGGFGELLL